jgi:diaminohydroxyphosphoribosylaminopyrimidine deaminase/5-amino-6-(5-phosphoribosylamino)uracil reductase
VNIENDEQGMQRALLLAEKGLFTTTPNPRVGCVIVKDGRVIGEGYTQPAGQAHAEISALDDAKRRGNDVQGATAYVTLEPCSHFGRTPPCADALIRSGLARVVAAIEDPNHLVAGAGLARLRAAGIAVECGVLADAAKEMNIGFFSRMQRGRPWVRVKLAISLDGKIALSNGESRWITSSKARADGHWWRARACAVLTGSGTILADDPQLTVREVETPRQPQRIVVDGSLRTGPHAKALKGGGAWIVTTQADAAQAAALRACGADILGIPGAHGKVDLPAMMQELGRRQINELHVEAGAGLSGALIEADCADELLIYLAPSVVGPGVDMLQVPPLKSLADRRRLRFHDVRQIGEELRILARFN